MILRVFISSVSSSIDIKKQQTWMLLILKSKGELFEEVDISDPANKEAKLSMQEKMRSLGKSETPPHLFRDKEYLGDYYDMYEAYDNEELKSFLTGPGR